MTELAFDPSNVSRDTPDYLIPKMDQYATSDPVYYRQLVIRDPGTPPEGASELSGALDPFAALPAEAPESPKEGVLLTFEQGWFQKGLALGRLLHSISLAPGEVTQVAVVDFSRQSRSSQTEAATQDESVQSANDAQLADNEIKNAVGKELQSGGSFQQNITDQTQLAGGFNIGIAGSSGAMAQSTAIGVAHSTSASESQLSADSVRNLHQTALAASQAVRSRRAAQVIETNERESQTVTSRVIANYNHMHSLNVLFFEVVQVFQLSSRVCGAERVVFVPMREVTFDEAAVRTHWRALSGILLRAGLKQQNKELLDLVDTDTEPQHAAVEMSRLLLSNHLRQLLGAMGKDPDAKDVHIDPPLESDVQRIFAFWDMEVQRHIDRDGADKVHNDPDYIKAQRWLGLTKQAHAAHRAALEALRPVLRVVDFFAAHQLWFNQQLWMGMDAGRIKRMVAGLTFKGASLENLMDPRPLGLIGRMVAFRLPHAEPTGDAAFAERFVHRPGDRSIPKASVALPSGGIFGEAVLGQGMAAERIDLTRFWNWQDSPIPILPPSMAPIDAGSRARDAGFTRVELDAALAQLQTMAPAERADFDALIGKIKEGFRDMSGREQLASTLSTQISAAASGATAAGEQFVNTMKNTQDFAIGLANSDVGKAAMAAVMAPAGGGGVSTVMGGILAGSKSVPSPGGAAPAPEPPAGGTTPPAP